MKWGCEGGGALWCGIVLTTGIGLWAVGSRKWHSGQMAAGSGQEESKQWAAVGLAGWTADNSGSGMGQRAAGSRQQWGGERRASAVPGADQSRPPAIAYRSS